MVRTGILWTVILVSIVHWGASSQNPPNIILIMADDLGYEALSMYGNESNKTPNLERMAVNGMLFQNCHSTPLCTPSRVQIMTGKYNFRNYVGFGILDPDETTFAHLLQEAGYTTCVAGKWQLYGNERQRELAGGHGGALPEEAGFDHYRLWQVRQLGSRYKNPLLHTKETGVETHIGEYGPDMFVDYILQFMENHSKEPFLVYYPMVLTHDPFEPTPKTTEYQEYDPTQRTNDPKYFPAMVQYMDQLIGRIVEKTENLGIAHNTLILFVGDNGTDRDVTSSVGNQQIRGNKGGTTNYSTHVPMIAYWPGHIQPGSLYAGLVDFTDFVPTLLDVAGAQIPNGNSQLDGFSFYPGLLGDETKMQSREWVFCHYDPNWGNFRKRRFVYDTNWKLYQNGEIYNLENDLQEEYPVAVDDLDPDEKLLIGRFQNVLDRMR